MNSLHISKLFIFILFFVYLTFANSYADSSKDDYLWLEFTKEDINYAGSRSFFIYYGEFPFKRKAIQDFESLESFYTFGEKDKNGRDIFYRIKIEAEEDRPYIKVSSAKENWCMLLVKYKKEIGGTIYEYLAKTSFFIFSNNKYTEQGNPADMAIGPNKFLDIRIFRERINEELTYNRIRGYPIRATLLFDNHPINNQSVDIINSQGQLQSYKTDKKGNVIYNLLIANKYINGEYEYDLILATFTSAEKIYKSTYTVFFIHGANSGEKSHYFKRTSFSHNVGMGISICIISVLITLATVLVIRKKAKI